MAISNRPRRYSMINFAHMIGPRILFPPSGSTVSPADRRHLLYMYRGISVDPPAGAPAVTQIRPFNTGAHGILSGQNIIGPRGL